MTREEIIKELERARAAYNYNAFAALTEAIEILTQKPKHVKAKWINPSQNPEFANREFFNDCSACGFTTMDKSNFCPNCGAQMEERIRTEKQITEITEEIREQILVHIDFANPDEVEVKCCTPNRYITCAIRYYGIQLDLITIYQDEEISECNRSHEIIFSREEVERIGQMAVLLDEARVKWEV